MSLLPMRRERRGLDRTICRAVASTLAVAALTVAARAEDPSSMPSTRPATAPTSSPASRGFDPAKHMHVSEVRPGMKGYGLTVLSGTDIVKFPVEVIGVLHNLFGPQQDVVMVRCLDEFMKNTGPIQGCSGSPIYLIDDTGKPRLIGAYAYGFELVKEPIVGVQPIESMLTLPTPGAEQVREAVGLAPMSVSLIERKWIPELNRKAPKLAATPQADMKGLTASGERLSPLVTPLAISGVSQRVADEVAPMLAHAGFHPTLAAAAHSDSSAANAKIEPGSVLAAQMLGGDMEMTAVGTCTEVLEGRAYGFGHPFNGEGATSIPMGAGQVHLVMPLLTASFKLGSIGSVSGAIDMDGQFGIAGMIGAKATTIPITVEVDDLGAGTTRTFHYQAAKHRTYSPDLIATALQASVLAERALPLEHTIDYSVDMNFAGNRKVSVNEVATSLDGFNVVTETSVPIVAFANNPFESVLVESVNARIVIKPHIEQLDIQSAAPAKASYQPGETVRINVRLRDPTGVESVKTVEVPLPKTLADGDHTINVSDGPGNIELEAQTRAYRFTVRSVDELYKAIQNLTTLGRSDAIYARLANGRDGVTIGTVPLPMMPPSRRAILAAAARPETAAVMDSSVVVVPLGKAVRGTAEVTIHVAKHLP